MSFRCEKCCYSTTIKCNFTKHLKTKKHIKNTYNLDNVSYDLPNNSEKSIKIPSQTLTKSINSLTNPHKKKCKIIKEKYSCDKCGKQFSRQDNLKRHITNYCGVNKNINKLISNIHNTHLKEKEHLKKQIEMLLTKVGNTTNNTTINNTIILNNYGNEDMSHISDDMKTQLLKIPYGMIPKMIEHVHFNDKKPENKNIIITNSRDNKLKIYKNNKWVYKDKSETLNDLVDNKYFILDSYFEKVEDNNNDINDSDSIIDNLINSKENNENNDNANNDNDNNENNENTLNKLQKENYKKFRELIDNGDKNLIENIKKDCEILLLNNR